MNVPTSTRIVAMLTCYGLITAGCHEPLDTTREPIDTGSFGDTVVTLVCKRVAYLEDLADGGTTDVRGDTYRDICREGLAPPDTAPGSLKALLAKHDDLVAAVDTMFPADFLDRLQAYLTSNEFLASYDDETTTRAIDALIGLFELLAADDGAMASLERLNVRLGYKPLTPALGAVRTAINYPEMHELLLALSQAITEGGGARTEWLNLIEALGVTLRNTEIGTELNDPDRTSRLAVDFLLTEQALLGTSRSIPLARRDARGLAEPAAIAGMFVDTDADGRADTNDVGQFVDAAGQVIAAPAPFTLPEGEEDVPWPYRDTEGRALDAPDGAQVYRYVDVDATVLSALARDGVQLFDPSKGTALDLLRGVSALMGTRQEVTRTYDDGESLTYRGYDVTDSPMLDMTYAYLQVLRDPAIYDLLALARTLLIDHEPEVARLAEAIIRAARMGDAHPEAVIPTEAPLWDDLVPVIKRVLDNPNLTTALLRALEHPQVKELGVRFAKFMKYKDRFDIDPDTQAVVGSFSTPVDRAAVDNAYNRSIFQRILHMISDSNGTRLCNQQDARVKQFGITLATFDECDLVDVPNLATFFVQSMTYAKDAQGRFICETVDGEFGNTTTATTAEGCTAQSGRRPRTKADFNFQWGNQASGINVEGALGLMGGDEFLESESGIAGFRTHPTPQGALRALFYDTLNLPTTMLEDTMDPARDKEGDLYSSQHLGTIPVWEIEGFYDQMRPVLQAFADHNAEQIFVDFMTVLHKHWPSEDSITHQSIDPQAPGYVFGSNGMTYEPLMIEIMEDRAVMDTLVDIAPVLNAVTANGKSYMTIARTAARFLVTPLAGLTDRMGNATSTTTDGREIPVLSPWNVIGDAYLEKHARMAEVAGEGAAWTDSISEVIDVLVRGVEVPTVGWRFSNPRFRGVSIALINFLESRLQRHDQLGDRTAWLQTEMPTDLQDMLAGPVLAGAADFILSLQAEPATREQLEKLMSYLVDEVSFGEAYGTTVTAVADLLQLAMSDPDIAPLCRVIGEALRPERGWLDAQLTFVRRAREADADRALIDLMVNMYGETAAGRTALGDLIDGISEVHRARPYVDLGARYTAADFRALLTGLAAFLDEERRGLRKFIAIIRDRNL